LVFSAFLVLVTVAFLGFRIQAGKERFAEEALKLLFYGGGGTVSGYAYAKARSRNSQTQSGDSDNAPPQP
jgi:hypothetical protein